MAENGLKVISLDQIIIILFIRTELNRLLDSSQAFPCNIITNSLEINALVAYILMDL